MSALKTSKRRTTGALLCGLVVLGAGGCYRNTIQVGGGAPAGPVVREEWRNFWLGGLIGHTRVDVDEICPSGDATVEIRQSFLNAFVSGLTSGIYTPLSLKVRCADGRRADVELSAAEVREVVADPAFLSWVRLELPERAEEVARARSALGQD